MPNGAINSFSPEERNWFNGQEEAGLTNEPGPCRVDGCSFPAEPRSAMSLIDELSDAEFDAILEQRQRYQKNTGIAIVGISLATAGVIVAVMAALMIHTYANPDDIAAPGGTRTNAQVIAADQDADPADSATPTGTHAEEDPLVLADASDEEASTDAAEPIIWLEIDEIRDQATEPTVAASEAEDASWSFDPWEYLPEWKWGQEDGAVAAAEEVENVDTPFVGPMLSDQPVQEPASATELAPAQPVASTTDAEPKSWHGATITVVSSVHGRHSLAYVHINGGEWIVEDVKCENGICSRTSTGETIPASCFDGDTGVHRATSECPKRELLFNI